MESYFPHAPPLSNLLAFLSSITPAFFWLVVAFEISIGSHLRPRRFLFYFVVVQFATPNNGIIWLQDIDKTLLGSMGIR
jgi:hypothetical protein